MLWAFLPPPHCGMCLPFYRENISGFSSLVDLRRIVPTEADVNRGSKTLILLSCRMFLKNIKNLVSVGIEVID